MALCADAEVKDGKLVGDPTEGALVVLAAKGGVDPQLTREQYPRVATLPFDAAYKLMATFHRMTDDAGKDVIRAYVKGAPDQLLARADVRPRARRRRGPHRPGPRQLHGRERSLRLAGPARPGDRPEGLRPRDLRRKRRSPPAHRRDPAARARRHRRPAPARGPRRDREGPRCRDPGPDDHRRPRGDRRGDRQPAGHHRAGRSRAPSSWRCPTKRPSASSTISASSPASRRSTRSTSWTCFARRATSSR